MVRVVGLEPTSLAALEPKSSMFTNFIIPAYSVLPSTFTRGGDARGGALRLIRVYKNRPRPLLLG